MKLISVLKNSVKLLGAPLVFFFIVGVLVSNQNKKTYEAIENASSKGCKLDHVTERTSALPGGIYTVFKCGNGSEIRAYGDLSQIWKERRPMKQLKTRQVKVAN